MDKIKHFAACLVVAVVASICLHPCLALLAALAVGVGKELYDKFIKRTTFDWVDIWADAWGAFLGAMLPMLVRMIEGASN